MYNGRLTRFTIAHYCSLLAERILQRMECWHNNVSTIQTITAGLIAAMGTGIITVVPHSNTRLASQDYSTASGNDSRKSDNTFTNNTHKALSQ